jgi:hypothetical protein
MGIDCRDRGTRTIEYGGETFFKLVLPSVIISNVLESRVLITVLGAPTSMSDVPNSNVALFDLAFPGSQPVGHSYLPEIGFQNIKSHSSGVSNRYITSCAACRSRPQLRDPTSEPFRSKALFLSGPTGRISDHTILWFAHFCMISDRMGTHF